MYASGTPLTDQPTTPHKTQQLKTNPLPLDLSCMLTFPTPNPPFSTTTTQQVRDGFRLHRAIDATVVPSLLVEANRHLDMLKSMASGPSAPPQRRSSLNSVSSSSSSFWAPDPWMVQQGEKEEEEEERRVGEGWPWERDGGKG